ncbi:unnamed protein product [Amoebophrya sp. A120]|nr:unnamed protein product [Amoebophrya sp. A120]|eukprot:GSA120T00020687001.1
MPTAIVLRTSRRASRGNRDAGAENNQNTSEVDPHAKLKKFPPSTSDLTKPSSSASADAKTALASASDDGGSARAGLPKTFLSSFSTAGKRPKTGLEKCTRGCCRPCRSVKSSVREVFRITGWKLGLLYGIANFFLFGLATIAVSTSFIWSMRYLQIPGPEVSNLQAFCQNTFLLAPLFALFVERAMWLDRLCQHLKLCDSIVNSCFFCCGKREQHSGGKMVGDAVDVSTSPVSSSLHTVSGPKSAPGKEKFASAVDKPRKVTNCICFSLLLFGVVFPVALFFTNKSEYDDILSGYEGGMDAARSSDTTGVHANYGLGLSLAPGEDEEDQGLTLEQMLHRQTATSRALKNKSLFIPQAILVAAGVSDAEYFLLQEKLMKADKILPVFADNLETQMFEERLEETFTLLKNAHQRQLGQSQSQLDVSSHAYAAPEQSSGGGGGATFQVVQQSPPVQSNSKLNNSTTTATLPSEEPRAEQDQVEGNEDETETTQSKNAEDNIGESSGGTSSSFLLDREEILNDFGNYHDEIAANGRRPQDHAEEEVVFAGTNKRPNLRRDEGKRNSSQGRLRHTAASGKNNVEHEKSKLRGGDKHEGGEVGSSTTGRGTSSTLEVQLVEQRSRIKTKKRRRLHAHLHDAVVESETKDGLEKAMINSASDTNFASSSLAVSATNSLARHFSLTIAFTTLGIFLAKVLLEGRMVQLVRRRNSSNAMLIANYGQACALLGAIVGSVLIGCGLLLSGAFFTSFAGGSSSTSGQDESRTSEQTLSNPTTLESQRRLELNQLYFLKHHVNNPFAVLLLGSGALFFVAVFVFATNWLQEGEKNPGGFQALEKVDVSEFKLKSFGTAAKPRAGDLPKGMTLEQVIQMNKEAENKDQGAAGANQQQQQGAYSTSESSNSGKEEKKKKKKEKGGHHHHHHKEHAAHAEGEAVDAPDSSENQVLQHPASTGGASATTASATSPGAAHIPMPEEQSGTSDEAGSEKNEHPHQPIGNQDLADKEAVDKILQDDEDEVEAGDAHADHEAHAVEHGVEAMKQNAVATSSTSALVKSKNFAQEPAGVEGQTNADSGLRVVVNTGQGLVGVQVAPEEQVLVGAMTEQQTTGAAEVEEHQDGHFTTDEEEIEEEEEEEEPNFDQIQKKLRHFQRDKKRRAEAQREKEMVGNHVDLQVHDEKAWDLHLLVWVLAITGLLLMTLPYWVFSSSLASSSSSSGSASSEMLSAANTASRSVDPAAAEHDQDVDLLSASFSADFDHESGRISRVAALPGLDNTTKQRIPAAANAQFVLLSAGLTTVCGLAIGCMLLPIISRALLYLMIKGCFHFTFTGVIFYFRTNYAREYVDGPHFSLPFVAAELPVLSNLAQLLVMMLLASRARKAIPYLTSSLTGEHYDEGGKEDEEDQEHGSDEENDLHDAHEDEDQHAEEGKKAPSTSPKKLHKNYAKGAPGEQNLSSTQLILVATFCDFGSQIFALVLYSRWYSRSATMDVILVFCEEFCHAVAIALNFVFLHTLAAKVSPAAAKKTLLIEVRSRKTVTSGTAGRITEAEVIPPLVHIGSSDRLHVAGLDDSSRTANPAIIAAGPVPVEMIHPHGNMEAHAHTEGEGEQREENGPVAIVPAVANNYMPEVEVGGEDEGQGDNDDGKEALVSAPDTTILGRGGRSRFIPRKAEGEAANPEGQQQGPPEAHLLLEGTKSSRSNTTGATGQPISASSNVNSSLDSVALARENQESTFIHFANKSGGNMNSTQQQQQVLPPQDYVEQTAVTTTSNSIKIPSSTSTDVSIADKTIDVPEEVVTNKSVTIYYTNAYLVYAIVLSCFLLGESQGAANGAILCELFGVTPNSDLYEGQYKFSKFTGVQVIAICCNFIPLLFLRALVSPIDSNHGELEIKKLFLNQGSILRKLIYREKENTSLQKIAEIHVTRQQAIAMNPARKYAETVAQPVVLNPFDEYHIGNVFGSQLPSLLQDESQAFAIPSEIAYWDETSPQERRKSRLQEYKAHSKVGSESEGMDDYHNMPSQSGSMSMTSRAQLLASSTMGSKSLLFDESDHGFADTGHNRRPTATGGSGLMEPGRRTAGGHHRKTSGSPSQHSRDPSKASVAGAPQLHLAEAEIGEG